MTESMRIAWGYDCWGNAPDLVCEKDKEALMNIVRVAGDTPCTCGMEYRKHPKVQGATWATRGCDRLVKL